MNDIKMAPFSNESESAIIGSIFREPDRIHEAKSLIDPEDLFSRDIRIIYNAMIKLKHKDQPIDMITLADELKNQKKFDDVGGVYKLSTLEDYPTATAIAFHCRKVRALAIKRKFIDKMQGIMNTAFEVNDDASTLLDEAHSSVFQLMGEVDSNSKTVDVYSPEDMAQRGYKNAKARFEDPEGESGYQTGFPLLDRYMKRLRDVNCIAASTGVGKTGLALNIALNLAIEEVPVLYINLEMNIDEIITRVLAILSGVEIDKIDTGDYGNTPEEFKLVARFAEKLEYSTQYMTDNTPKNINHITSLIHKYHAKHGIKVVVVDYIGHIRNDKLAF